MEADITSNMRGESIMTQEEMTGQEIAENTLINKWVERYMKEKDLKCRLTAQYNAVGEQNKSLQAENIKIKADNSKLFEKAVEARKETDDIFERLQQKEQECESITQECEYLNKQNERLVNEKYNLHVQCERMQIALHKIRNYELAQLDIDWDEYETCCRETEYSPIIDYCEVGLGEVEDV